jgi:hypothetical protein
VVSRWLLLFRQMGAYPALPPLPPPIFFCYNLPNRAVLQSHLALNDHMFLEPSALRFGAWGPTDEGSGCGYFSPSGHVQRRALSAGARILIPIDGQLWLKILASSQHRRKKRRQALTPFSHVRPEARTACNTSIRAILHLPLGFRVGED